MWTQLLYKWFGIVPRCETCEVLRLALDESNRERKELLHRLLDKDKPEPLIEKSEPPQPIMPQFVPWRVRQQMLEAEDRKKAQLIREREKEIAEINAITKTHQNVAELEKELGVAE